MGGVETEEIKEIHRKHTYFRNDFLCAEKAEVKAGDYTLNELKVVFKKMKKRKPPGPDGVAGDLLKIMDDGSLTIVLETISYILQKGEGRRPK
jgi:hypothetical protein